MEYERLSANRVDMNRFDPESIPQNIFANIVVVDKSHEGIFPIAYQFQHDIDYTDDALMHFDSHHMDFSHDAFLMLGEIEVLSKSQKVIILRRGGTIHYKHLIVISHANYPSQGSVSQQREFVAALQTLVDALRTQKSIGPSSVKQEQSDKELASSTMKVDDLKSARNVRQVFYSKVNNDPYATLATIYGPGGKRLYELHL